MMWQVADFSGVRVITYAVMKNHFHILAEVPEQGTPISDEELVRRFRRLYPRPTPWQPMPAEVLEKHLKNNELEGVLLRKQLIARMHDVSQFMKTLKLRFTLWFNRSRGRFGTLWSERFKSVLVEGDSFALKTVAAYIDLNAVRAGIVDDPKDYRFCGYGEAVGAGGLARAGLRSIDRDLAGYRQTLYGKGAESKEGKTYLSREEALKVLGKRGKLPLSEILRCRVRYFSDGYAIGSEAFLREQLKSSPPLSKVRPMDGADWGGLSVGNGLRQNLFS